MSSLKWWKIKTKRQSISNNADRLYFEEISVHISKITDHCMCVLPSPVVLTQRLQRSTILKDSVQFQLQKHFRFFSVSAWACFSIVLNFWPKLFLYKKECNLQSNEHTKVILLFIYLIIAVLLAFVSMFLLFSIKLYKSFNILVKLLMLL